MDSLISCCGLDCSKCHLYKNMCEGCNACHGKVFYAPKGQACPIYECAVNKMDLSHVQTVKIFLA